jgi:hypothetical protein
VITLFVAGIAALAIVEGVFVAVCIEALVAPNPPKRGAATGRTFAGLAQG